MFLSKYLLPKKDKEPSHNIKKSLSNNCKDYIDSKLKISDVCVKGKYLC